MVYTKARNECQSRIHEHTYSHVFLYVVKRLITENIVSFRVVTDTWSGTKHKDTRHVHGDRQSCTRVQPSCRFVQQRICELCLKSVSRGATLCLRLIRVSENSECLITRQAPTCTKAIPTCTKGTPTCTKGTRQVRRAPRHAPRHVQRAPRHVQRAPYM